MMQSQRCCFLAVHTLRSLYFIFQFIHLEDCLCRVFFSLNAIDSAAILHALSHSIKMVVALAIYLVSSHLTLVLRSGSFIILLPIFYHLSEMMHHLNVAFVAANLLPSASV